MATAPSRPGWSVSDLGRLHDACDRARLSLAARKAAVVPSPSLTAGAHLERWFAGLGDVGRLLLASALFYCLI